MTEPIEEPKGILPEGDDDPNLIYIAVGMALHSWEEMEETIANLYLKMIGIPTVPDNYATHYGTKYRKFSERMIAIQKAAATYFVSHPDQAKEGVFCTMVEKIEGLAIYRHRIAHGHIARVVEVKHPTNPKAGEPVKLTLTFDKFRWAAPFYSTGSLRTDFIGGNAKSIDQTREKFMAMHNEIGAFTATISP
jgi:hypothetical protein